MKNHLIRSFIAFCLIIFSSGCSKIYDPQLEVQNDILVVEAHMSDALEKYIVELSLTTRFNSSGINNPVSGARVWVTDDNNRSLYLYSETRQGQYSFSPSAGEVGITGHTYSLHIKTANGDDYESSPQVMVSPVLVDSVYGIKRSRTELLKSPDGSSEFNVKKTYIDIITDIHCNINSTPKVRFDPDWIFEMIDYHRDIIGGPPVPTTFSWTYTENNSLAISKATVINILPEQYSGSLLIDNLTGLNADKNLVNVIMVMNYFSLSDDSYRFYNEMNKQLSSNDALFDPITQQIEGNMKCVNKPEKQVAGLFEVASHKRVVFIVNSISENSQPVFKKVTSFHALPDETNGQTEGIPPYWWFE
jgi:hypothetical protein